MWRFNAYLAGIALLLILGLGADFYWSPFLPARVTEVGPLLPYQVKRTVFHSALIRGELEEGGGFTFKAPEGWLFRPGTAIPSLLAGEHVRVRRTRVLGIDLAVERAARHREPPRYDSRWFIGLFTAASLVVWRFLDLARSRLQSPGSEVSIDWGDLGAPEAFIPLELAEEPSRPTWLRLTGSALLQALVLAVAFLAPRLLFDA